MPENARDEQNEPSVIPYYLRAQNIFQFNSLDEYYAYQSQIESDPFFNSEYDMTSEEVLLDENTPNQKYYNIIHDQEEIDKIKDLEPKDFVEALGLNWDDVYVRFLSVSRQDRGEKVIGRWIKNCVIFGDEEQRDILKNTTSPETEAIVAYSYTWGNEVPVILARNYPTAFARGWKELPYYSVYFWENLNGERDPMPYLNEQASNPAWQNVLNLREEIFDLDELYNLLEIYLEKFKNQPFDRNNYKFSKTDSDENFTNLIKSLQVEMPNYNESTAKGVVDKTFIESLYNIEGISFANPDIADVINLYFNPDEESLLIHSQIVESFKRELVSDELNLGENQGDRNPSNEFYQTRNISRNSMPRTQEGRDDWIRFRYISELLNNNEDWINISVYEVIAEIEKIEKTDNHYNFSYNIEDTDRGLITKIVNEYFSLNLEDLRTQYLNSWNSPESNNPFPNYDPQGFNRRLEYRGGQYVEVLYGQDTVHYSSYLPSYFVDEGFIRSKIEELVREEVVSIRDGDTNDNEIQELVEKVLDRIRSINTKKNEIYIENLKLQSSQLLDQRITLLESQLDDIERKQIVRLAEQFPDEKTQNTFQLWHEIRWLFEKERIKKNNVSENNDNLNDFFNLNQEKANSEINLALIKFADYLNSEITIDSYFEKQLKMAESEYERWKDPPSLNDFVMEQSGKAWFNLMEANGHVRSKGIKSQELYFLELEKEFKSQMYSNSSEEIQSSIQTDHQKGSVLFSLKDVKERFPDAKPIQNIFRLNSSYDQEFQHSALYGTLSEGITLPIFSAGPKGDKTLVISFDGIFFKEYKGESIDEIFNNLEGENKLPHGELRYSCFIDGKLFEGEKVLISDDDWQLEDILAWAALIVGIAAAVIASPFTGGGSLVAVPYLVALSSALSIGASLKTMYDKNKLGELTSKDVLVESLSILVEAIPLVGNIKKITSAVRLKKFIKAGGVIDDFQIKEISKFLLGPKFNKIEAGIALFEVGINTFLLADTIVERLGEIERMKRRGEINESQAKNMKMGLLKFASFSGLMLVVSGVSNAKEFTGSGSFKPSTNKEILEYSNTIGERGMLKLSMGEINNFHFSKAKKHINSNSNNKYSRENQINRIDEIEDKFNKGIFKETEAIELLMIWAKETPYATISVNRAWQKIGEGKHFNPKSNRWERIRQNNNFNNYENIKDKLPQIQTILKSKGGDPHLVENSLRRTDKATLKFFEKSPEELINAVQQLPSKSVKKDGYPNKKLNKTAEKLNNFRKANIKKNEVKYIDLPESDKAARDYESIRNTQEDVKNISEKYRIPAEVIDVVKNHIFHNVYDIPVGPNKINIGRFAPIDEIGDIWKRAANGSLHPDKMIGDFTEPEFLKRLIAHEYVEAKLMESGLWYRSPEPGAWKGNEAEGYLSEANKGYYGAHDLAPYFGSKENPFKHIEFLDIYDVKGITLKDDLSNLDNIVDHILSQLNQNIKLSSKIQSSTLNDKNSLLKQESLGNINPIKLQETNLPKEDSKSVEIDSKNHISKQVIKVNTDLSVGYNQYSNNTKEIMKRHNAPPPEPGYHYAEIDVGGTKVPIIKRNKSKSADLEKKMLVRVESEVDGGYKYEIVKHNKQPISKDFIHDEEIFAKALIYINELNPKAKELANEGIFDRFVIENIIGHVLKSKTRLSPEEVIEKLSIVFRSASGDKLKPLLSELSSASYSHHKGAILTLDYISNLIKENPRVAFWITKFEKHESKDGVTRIYDLVIGGSNSFTRMEFKFSTDIDYLANSLSKQILNDSRISDLELSNWDFSNYHKVIIPKEVLQTPKLKKELFDKIEKKISTELDLIKGDNDRELLRNKVLPDLFEGF